MDGGFKRQIVRNNALFEIVLQNTLKMSESIDLKFLESNDSMSDNYSTGLNRLLYLYKESC